jgi:hypothetical protein
VNSSALDVLYFTFTFVTKSLGSDAFDKTRYVHAGT